MYQTTRRNVTADTHPAKNSSFAHELAFFCRDYTDVDFVLLGAFAELRKATISFLMSVRLFVRMEQMGSHGINFDNILYLRFFENPSRKFKSH
jgi:hypothetical protein